MAAVYFPKLQKITKMNTLTHSQTPKILLDDRVAQPTINNSNLSKFAPLEPVAKIKMSDREMTITIDSEAVVIIGYEEFGDCLEIYGG